MAMKTGLKEGGGIEISIYSAFHIRDARSLSLFVFTYQFLALKIERDAYILVRHLFLILFYLTIEDNFETRCSECDAGVFLRLASGRPRRWPSATFLHFQVESNNYWSTNVLHLSLT